MSGFEKPILQEGFGAKLQTHIEDKLRRFGVDPIEAPVDSLLEMPITDILVIDEAKMTTRGTELVVGGRN